MQFRRWRLRQFQELGDLMGVYLAAIDWVFPMGALEPLCTDRLVLLRLLQRLRVQTPRRRNRLPP